MSSKVRYNQKYKLDREKCEDLKGWLSKGSSEYSGYCQVCRKELNVASGGKDAFVSHSKVPAYIAAAKTVQNTRGGMDQYLSNSVAQDKATRAEVMMVNFLAEHHQSFNIMDHFTLLVTSMFPDSDIARQFQCSRTKATAIIKKALAPELREPMIEMLQSTGKPYSIIIDESTDRGEEKLSAMLIKYFHDDSLRVETKFYRVEVVNYATGINM